MRKNIKKTISDYYQLASQNGIEFIGEIPKNANHKSKWRCPVGHEWETTYENIRSGTNCPTCSMDSKRIYFEQDYKDKAARFGYEFIGPVPQSTKFKTGWRCSHNHEWDVSFVSLRGCPYCASNGMKLPEDYHALADRTGNKWLGPVVNNTNEKTYWISNKCGHKFSTNYACILRGDSCNVCRRNRKKTEDEYILLAKTRGVDYLGPYPRNTFIKTGWRCKRGHTIQKTYNSISNDHICRQCYRIDNSGPNNSKWKGGPFTYGEGFTLELKQEIRKRDSRKCQICGINKNRGFRSMDVHHIVPARNAPESLKHSPKNLISLCRKHHAEMDGNLNLSIPLLRNIMSSKYGYEYNDDPFSYLANL